MSALVKWTDQVASMIPAQGGITLTLDPSTREGKRHLYMAITGSDFTLDELKGEKIKVSNVVVHWVADPGDEEKPPGMRVRGVLIGPDGTRISTGSETALRCLETAAKIIMVPAPWEPPLEFTVRHEKRRDGPGHYILLEWVLESD